MYNLNAAAVSFKFHGSNYVLVKAFVDDLFPNDFTTLRKDWTGLHVKDLQSDPFFAARYERETRVTQPLLNRSSFLYHITKYKLINSCILLQLNLSQFKFYLRVDPVLQWISFSHPCNFTG